MQENTFIHETLFTARVGQGWGARVAVKSPQGEVAKGVYPPFWGEYDSLTFPIVNESDATTEREAVERAYNNALAVLALKNSQKTQPFKKA